MPMFILETHNLREKDYHKKVVTVLPHNQEQTAEKHMWVDKDNGRYHIESYSPDIFNTDEPLAFWWLVNRNDRVKMPYSRQRTEKLHDMPPKYNATVRIKLEHHRPSRADKVVPRVRLEKTVIEKTTFGFIHRPCLVGAVMPHGTQRSSLEITTWVSYLVIPVGKTMCLLSPEYIDEKYLVA